MIQSASQDAKPNPGDQKNILIVDDEILIAQAFSRTSKLARISKISHSTKFFSKHSGFNKYLHDEKAKKEKINPRRRSKK